ncbi:MAG: UDP-galactopyranose mutase [Oligoflexia bacterium]|nr:UDP-galactopyranose mutase [Oligoflexia bacterium]
MDFSQLKFLVVGAGFSGAVIAERIANIFDEVVLVIDKRAHLGGNCSSLTDSNTGIEYHRYGTHIFHTNNSEVWSYIQRFTKFNQYQHKVLTLHQGKTYPLPINLWTINMYLNKNFSPEEAEKFINIEISNKTTIESTNETASESTNNIAFEKNIHHHINLETKAISLIGSKLYNAFIRNYTYKQWNTCPSKLPAATINRLPVRFNYNTNYFDDPFQGIPNDGYEKIFEKILSHRKIKYLLSTDYQDIKNHLPPDCLIIYSAPIDEFFQYKLGPLGWRGLSFEKEVYKLKDYQGTAVMNFSDLDTPFTRIHEFKHLHPERKECFNRDQTVIYKEYSQNWLPGKIPYYPINTPENNSLYQKYVEAAKNEKHVVFVGRLGRYRYLDMDKAIGEALNIFENEIKEKICPKS